MTDIVALSDALVERVTPVLQQFEPVWAVEWFKPDPIITLPLLCVTADPKFVDYTMVPPMWSLRLSFYLSAADQETSRRSMSTMFDHNGPIVAALESTDTRDTLWTLAPYGVVATAGKGWTLTKEKRNTYLYAEMGVQISAN